MYTDTKVVTTAANTSSPTNVGSDKEIAPIVVRIRELPPKLGKASGGATFRYHSDESKAVWISGVTHDIQFCKKVKSNCKLPRFHCNCKLEDSCFWRN